MKHLYAMRNLIFAFVCIGTSYTIQAQYITSSSMSDTSQHPLKVRVVVDTSTLIEERLVQLALKQPQTQVAGYEEKIAEYQLSKAKKSWLDLLSLSTNYNDQSFAKKSNNATYVYPKYFFGISVPLGLIFNGSSSINMAKESVEINKAQQEELARTIRADVLSKYKEYKTYVQLLALQNQVIDDQQAVFLQTEQKFRDGSITIDVYNTASKSYNEDLATRLNLQLQEDLIKLEIEKMIGMRLEDAIKIGNTK